MIALLTAMLVCASDPVAAQVVDTTRADDALLRELETEMTVPAQQQTRPRPTTNPDISVIGDARAWTRSRGERSVDLGIHEVESAFRSTVDPYARADIYFAVESHEGEFEFELEEAYLTTLALPAGLQVRAGKFRSAFGKINRTHPHALPFIDTPAPYANYLGEHGLNDQGVSINWLVPNASFYQDVSFEVTSGPGEGESFAASERNRLLYVAHAKNFWELSPETTLEFGLGGAIGPNADDGQTRLLGADLTVRWKPLRFNTYRSFTLQIEGMLSHSELSGGDVDGVGLYGLVGYQLGRRWWLYGRFDHSDRPDDAGWNENVVSGTLGWYLTEFQKLEFGINHRWARDLDPVTEGLVRLIFVIGTHGAHEY